MRDLKLTRSPLCEDPYRRHARVTALAREVDHIVPLQLAPESAYALENLQSLCRSCHAYKSALERE